jgi:diacylglycerol kinase family enzyme
LKICCILNEKSGGADLAGCDVIVDLFSKRGVRVDIFKMRDGNSISDLAKHAVKQNYDVIVASGGDGTIRASIQFGRKKSIVI